MQLVSIHGELCTLASVTPRRYAVRDSRGVQLARAPSRFLAITKAAEVLLRRVMACAAS